MIETFTGFISTNTPSAIGTRLALILIITWFSATAGSWLFVKFLKAQNVRWRRMESRRFVTLEALLRSAIKVGVYTAGFVVMLFNLGIPGGSILTAAALFSAGFGFAARPIISDYLTGIIFIFEDQFAVGDKVEIMEIMGEVEAVDLRATHLRAPSGELYIVPNGDVRVVRNLSRGLFSIATIKVTVATEDLTQALDVLARVADAAPSQLDSLIERPHFFSEEGTISNHVPLTLSAKARYGQGARCRTRLMALVTEALNEADVRIIA